MPEEYGGDERAILVHAYQHEQYEGALNEFETLVHSAGVSVVSVLTMVLKKPHSKYFIGSGKAEELSQLVKDVSATIIIFDHTLTPSQERNLEILCECRVIDRTRLILDIFAQRARTHEGKLQVELAQLRHLSTRLVRGWTHLERQKGGIGLRGPGETQLETDRRLLQHRIQFLLSRLARVERQREQNRQARKKADIAVLSLVGYTNAGKSTLFNVLTNADVYVADQLFATLDPTLRKIDLDNTGHAILVDTVGFIRDLPHELVAAFKATLQETRQATLLLHVVDAADPHHFDHITAVEQVLDEIDANNIPSLLIMNKIDQLDGVTPRIDYNQQGAPIRVWLSAQQKIGLPLLYQALTEILAKQIKYEQLLIPAAAAHLRSLLYEKNAVTSEQIDEAGNFILHIKLPLIKWNRLCKQEHDLIYFLQHK